jgi:hypothetical protein
MPTITLSDNEKPGLPQIKRYILAIVKRSGGSIDRAQLIAHLQTLPLFRPALVLQALQDLQNEGKISQV